MILRILIFSSVLFYSCFLQAQQEPHYTHYMYNKMGINPGYAGSQNGSCLSLLYRNQWIGLEGAPESQILSFNTALLRNKVGLGINLSRHTIGVSQNISGEMSYAYRMPIAGGNLGIGIQASIRNIGVDYNDDRLVATDGLIQDGGIPVGQQNRTIPNFGAGLYYAQEKFYLGFSIPRLINNNIDFNDFSGDVAREVFHAYLMGGILFQPQDGLTVQPQFLFKYAENAPFDADLNVTLGFNEKFYAGISYRFGGGANDLGESLDLLGAIRINEQWLFGLSYDFTLSEIRDYSSGSLGAILRFCFNMEEGNDIVNPRFF